MPKELFNQNLINAPVTPDDNDRVGLGQPSVSGGKNIVWSYLKRLLSWTDKITISDPSTESLDGLGDNQQHINRETVTSIFAIRDAIRQIAGAAATIEADPKPQTIDDVETAFTFIEAIASTNTDIIEVDELNNQITIKQKGIYQFATFLNVENNPPSGDKNLTLRTRNALTSDIITERTLIVPNAGYSGTSTFTFEVLEADVPLTIDFFLQGDATGMVLQELQSTLLTGAQVNTGGGLGIVGYETNVAIRAITGYTAGNDALNLLTGAWYKFDTAETATDDDDIYLTPNNITEPDPGRWVKQEIFAKKDYVDEVNQQPSILSQYDSNTTMADPGAGKFRLNAGQTQLALNYQEPSGSNIKIHANKLSNGSTLKLQVKGDDSKYKNINVTGITDNTTWALIDISVDNEGNAFVLDDIVGVIIVGGSGGAATYTDLTDTPAIKVAKKLQKVNDAATELEDTPYNYDQVVNTADIDVSDPTWQENESRLLEVKKVAGAAAFEGATQLIDIFAPPGNDTALINQSGWTDETKTLTGENFLGELGKTGQLRVLTDGTICRCISSVQGTDGGANGSATYRRNRAVDTLDPANNTQDSAVADLLDPSRTGGTTDDGWDLVNNTKVISTIPARVGTWWKVAGGYSYFCYAVSGSSYYWFRDGTPAAIYRYITTTNYPTLTTNLLAHDFGVSVYTEVGGDETSYQDQVFYNLATREYFVKVNSTQWEKLK